MLDKPSITRALEGREEKCVMFMILRMLASGDGLKLKKKSMCLMHANTLPKAKGLASESGESGKYVRKRAVVFSPITIIIWSSNRRLH